MNSALSSELNQTAKTIVKQPEFIQKLRDDRDRFVAFSFASSDILLELDAQQNIIFADGALHGLLGYQPDALLGKPLAGFVPDADQPIFSQMLEALSSGARSDHHGLHITSAFNDEIPFTISAFRIDQTQSAHIYLALSLQHDASGHAPAIKRDPDSGLLNKTGFVDEMNQALERAKQSGEELQLTLLDFPELQAFLDQLSPDAAKGLLAEISEHLQSHSSGGHLAGKIGEEAFGLMHDAAQPATEILGDVIAMTRKYDPQKQGLDVRSATMEADCQHLTSHDTANVLLYTLNRFAQDQGEGFNITSLSDSYDTLLQETVARIGDFKQTLQESAFDIAFQPIVDLKNGIIHHFEALVRMKDPEKFKNPYEFITFGEQAGVIADFDLLMTQRVLEILQKTSMQGNKPVVGVNISGRSASSALFRDALLEIINKYQRFSKQMIFELTESARIDDMQAVNGFIQQLRQGGSLCCLDDFGTGESSFDYLRNLQVDFIKIDGSYVRESLQTQRGRHMLKAMAGLCRELQVTTIGEMVEDEKAAALLWECGVKFGQGYLFGKPEIDVETLINCKKPTPFYGGMLRARKMKP